MTSARNPSLARPTRQGELDTQPRPADDAAGLAALQWVPGSEMQAKGLTSGVKKVRSRGGCAG